MRRFALVVIAVTLLSGSVVQAASYQMTTGTIVDPIQDVFGSPHSYSGNNLEPGADLAYALLAYADLVNADMKFAYLSDANLTSAYLDAYLDYATFSTGTTLYDGQTVLQQACRPTWRRLLSRPIPPAI